MSIKQTDLSHFLDQYLEISNFNDYAPNGLQVLGKNSVKKIAFCVSATRASIEQAVKEKADALIVHHGIFWRHHGARALTGPLYHRVAPLIKNDINLISYHLPLDAHMQSGNAAQLALKLELVNLAPLLDSKKTPLGVKAYFPRPLDPLTLKLRIEEVLHHPVMFAQAEGKKIESIGIITGGAHSEWKLALEQKMDAYLTGEMSEYDWHESQEAGIHMYAGGHHATEEFGIKALMQIVSETFPVETFYIKSENPA